MKVVVAFLSAFLFSGVAHAGPLTVSVRDGAGRPVANAVATVYPASGLPRGPIRFAWPLRMSQENIDFNPEVLIVPVGGTVSFPNLDRVRHQVYSFSRGNRFEVPLYSRGEAPTRTFSTVGVAALGCNIHDEMVAWIKVVDTPWAAKTNAQGNLVLTGIPAGGATLKIWHPRLAGRGNEISQTLTIGAGAMSRTVTGDFSARSAR